jgi:hypothetical protein
MPTVKKTLNRFGATLGAVLAVFVLAACASTNGTANSADKTVVYHMDYPSYDTVDSLYKTADLVVEASIANSSRTIQLGPAPNVNDPKLNPNAGTGAQPAGDPLVATVFQAKVTRVHKGSAKIGDTVDVKQLGGQAAGVTYRAEGVTMLKSGPTYLLFLALFPDAPASLLNPDQAQYPLDATGKPTNLGTNTITFSPADLTRLSAAK